MRWPHLPRLRRASPPKEPINIGLALALTLTVALAITGAVTWAGLKILRVQHVTPEPQLTAPTFINLLKIAFAAAAGIGGVVALVTTYRRQRFTEIAEHRQTAAERREDTRLFNERFATATSQLGHEAPAIRLAGVYALAGLADDWPAQRQTCVDVLCAYLRMPYKPRPPDDAPQHDHIAWQAAHEVRHTVIRVIKDHLQPDVRRPPTLAPWHGLDLDFTAVTFDGGDLSGAHFTSGTTTFKNAKFSGGIVDFKDAEFSGGTVDFEDAHFVGGEVHFLGARFSGAGVYFMNSEFGGGTVDFGAAEFSGGAVGFGDAEFSGSAVGFVLARFNGGAVDFMGTRFFGGEVDFGHALFSGGTVDFGHALFGRGTVDFTRARFSDGTVDFQAAAFTGSTVDFKAAAFSGGTVDFTRARFSDGTVDLSQPRDWSKPPLIAGTPNTKVLLLPTVQPAAQNEPLPGSAQ